MPRDVIVQRHFDPIQDEIKSLRAEILELRNELAGIRNALVAERPTSDRALIDLKESSDAGWPIFKG